jgi:DNA invertase Pin-like site-specific DNA recombinase
MFIRNQRYPRCQNPTKWPRPICAAATTTPKQVSIGRQRDFCLAAAALHGYEIPGHLVFVDEGILGALRERPGLTAMLNAARSGEVAAVFTYDEDRLARNHGYAWLIVAAREHKLLGVRTARFRAHIN